jgi:hypothetical protein
LAVDARSCGLPRTRLAVLCGLQLLLQVGQLSLQVHRTLFRKVNLQERMTSRRKK